MLIVETITTALFNIPFQSRTPAGLFFTNVFYRKKVTTAIDKRRLLSTYRVAQNTYKT